MDFCLFNFSGVHIFTKVFFCDTRIKVKVFVRIFFDVIVSYIFFLYIFYIALYLSSFDSNHNRVQNLIIYGHQILQITIANYIIEKIYVITDSSKVMVLNTTKRKTFKNLVNYEP